MRPTSGNLAAPARATPRAWQPVCAAAIDPARAPAAGDGEGVRRFLQTYLQPWRLNAADGKPATNTVTGYYEPLVRGSRRQGGNYQWPLYAVPADLLTIDLGSVYPDLAGKRVGATQPQSSTWLMALYLMQKAGVADKVDIRPLGDLATMLGALKTGSVAASMATMSMMEQARQEGWGVPIFDATTEASWNEFMGGDVPGIAALTLQDTIQKRPETVQAFVTGLVRAQDFITAHSAAEIADVIYDDYLNAFPRAAIEKTLGVYKETVFLKDNIITEDAYNRMTAIMGDGRQFSNEEIKTVPYAKCVNMSFVRKARGL
mgnify:CR=1 FL=1